MIRGTTELVSPVSSFSLCLEVYFGITGGGAAACGHLLFNHQSSMASEKNIENAGRFEI